MRYIFLQDIKSCVLKISAILAMIVFHLHRLHSKDVLRDWYSIGMLNNIELFALIGLLIGLAMTVWYVFVQVYYESRKFFS